MPASEAQREQLFDLVRRWRESGVAARVFAREHGVSASVLYYWHDRFRQASRPSPSRPSRAVTLAPVHLVDGAAADSGPTIEIVLATGDRLRCPVTMPVETLESSPFIVEIRERPFPFTLPTSSSPAGAAARLATMVVRGSS